MRKIIVLAVLVLLLASASWSAHHNSLSIEIGTSLTAKTPGGGGHGPSVLMENAGYVLMETGDTILLDP